MHFARPCDGEIVCAVPVWSSPLAAGSSEVVHAVKCIPKSPAACSQPVMRHPKAVARRNRRATKSDFYCYYAPAVAVLTITSGRRLSAIALKYIRYERWMMYITGNTASASPHPR
jgi:hypothetical protein